MQRDDLKIHFPDTKDNMDQDEEFCVLDMGECTKKIRFHDYHEIFQVEGLYEHLFYDVLKCNSPNTVCNKVMTVAEDAGLKPENLNILDIGAGNGMVGEELRSIGADKVIGIDIIQEAKDAQLRDRPDVYEDYFVQDLTDLDNSVRKELMSYNLNCMTTVAALGFGDIPTKAFSEGFNLIEEKGVVSFNIRDKFIEEADTSDFSDLIETIEGERILDIQVKEKYRHRLDVHGNPIYYYVIAGIKNRDIPDELVEQIAVQAGEARHA